MSTPEIDLYRYEREQERIDALEEEAERKEAEWERDNATCDYCGNDILEGETARTIANGAERSGEPCDTTMCEFCFQEKDDGN